MVSDATRQFQQLAEAATGFRFGKREFVDSGVINFVLRRRTAKAKFVRVPHNVRTAALVTELGRNWGFNEPPAPGCILRITGGPQGLARGKPPSPLGISSPSLKPRPNPSLKPRPNPSQAWSKASATAWSMRRGCATH